jgi:hypothetical protein
MELQKSAESEQQANARQRAEKGYCRVHSVERRVAGRMHTAQHAAMS